MRTSFANQIAGQLNGNPLKSLLLWWPNDLQRNRWTWQWLCQFRRMSGPKSRGARAWQRLFPACLLEGVETAGDGSCQFLTILFSAGLPVDVQDFRGEIVSYLKQHGSLFEEKLDLLQELLAVPGFYAPS